MLNTEMNSSMRLLFCANSGDIHDIHSYRDDYYGDGEGYGSGIASGVGFGQGVYDTAGYNNGDGAGLGDFD